MVNPRARMLSNIWVLAGQYTLSFSDHIEQKKLSKILGVFSRARLALTLEAANQVYTAMMVLPIVDYCYIVSCGTRPVKETITWSNVYREELRIKSLPNWVGAFKRALRSPRPFSHHEMYQKRRTQLSPYFKLRNSHIHNYNTRNRQ